MREKDRRTRCPVCRIMCPVLHPTSLLADHKHRKQKCAGSGLYSKRTSHLIRQQVIGHG